MGHKGIEHQCKWTAIPSSLCSKLHGFLILQVSLLQLPGPCTQALFSHASSPQLESGLHHAVPGGELRPPCISGPKSLLPDLTPLNSRWGTIRL